MAIIENKTWMYNLARVSARRKFILECRHAADRVSFSLSEEQGLEEKISLGSAKECDSENSYAYNGMNVAESSIRMFCATFSNELERLEGQAYEKPVIRKSIAEIRKLLTGERYDFAVIRQAYWILEPEPFSEDFFRDENQQRRLLEAAIDCSEQDHDTNDVIFIDGLHLLSKLWRKNEMLFTPITYYITLCDPQSERFRQELKQYSKTPAWDCSATSL